MSYIVGIFAGVEESMHIQENTHSPLKVKSRTREISAYLKRRQHSKVSKFAGCLSTNFYPLGTGVGKWEYPDFVTE